MKLRQSPTGRDIGEVQRENDALTRRANIQEEEFRLQNDTMRRELDEVNKYFLFIYLY